MILFRNLLNKKHYILLCLMAGAVLFNAYAFFHIMPTYQSTAILYIVTFSNDSGVSEADLEKGSILIEDYENMILSQEVLQEAVEELDWNISTDALGVMISIDNPEETRVLKITATSTEREEARDAANQVAKAAVNHLSEMSEKNIVQEARLAETKSGPNYMIYTLIGAIVGAFLYCDYVIIRYLMDNTIHTAEDLEKVFGITPLAVIPENAIVLKTIETSGVSQNKKGNRNHKTPHLVLRLKKRK